MGIALFFELSPNPQFLWYLMGSRHVELKQFFTICIPPLPAPHVYDHRVSLGLFMFCPSCSLFVPNNFDEFNKIRRGLWPQGV